MLALLLPTLGGCFDYEERVVVNEDGSVEIHMTASVLETAMPFIKKRKEYALFLASAAGRDRLTQILPKNVEVLHAKAVKDSGWVHTDLGLKVKSFADLTGSLGDLTGGQTVKFYEDADGSYVFERVLYQPTVTTELPTDLMYKVENDHWTKSEMRFEMTTPMRVRETNGTALNNHTIRWQTNMASVRKLGLRLYARFDAPPAPLWSRWYVVLALGALGAGLLAWALWYWRVGRALERHPEDAGAARS